MLLESVFFLIVVADQTHMLAEGAVQRNTCKTSCEDEAAERNVEIGGPLFTL